MRALVGWILWINVLSATPQTLVLAGCESEHQAQIAEQLIEQVHQSNYKRSSWEEECRKAGFEVVGDSAVVYLIPAYYTPAFIERFIIPLVEQLSTQPIPLCRLQELSPSLQQAILSLANRPQLVHFGAAEPSADSLRTKLQQGEILIGLGDAWWFESIEEPGKTPIAVVAESRRQQIAPNRVLSLFSHSVVPESSKSAAESRLSRERVKQWRFLFSHPLPPPQQAEHMKAYLEWLTHLQSQMAKTLPSGLDHLWKIFYPNKTIPSVGISFSFDELQSLLGDEVRLLPVESSYPTQLVFRKWEVGLEFVKRTADGRGVERHFIPLEVLLGVRDY